MKTASAFNYVKTPNTRVTVRVDDESYALPEGENLAAALLAAGLTQFRTTPVSGAARAPFCMMGACFDCLVRIDGVTRQACMVEVSSGLVVQKLTEVRGASHDTL